MTRRTFFGFLSGLMATTAAPVAVAVAKPLAAPAPTPKASALHDQVFS
jgi:hypothetical protein